MTEKRYTTMWKPETTFSRFWIVRENWERKLNANDVVDLLNEQHEQIEDLKDANVRCCNEYSYFHERMMQVEKENEQLKQFKEKVFTLIDKEIARNEEAIEWGKETGADSGAMGFYNHMLKRLKKELSE